MKENFTEIISQQMELHIYTKNLKMAILFHSILCKKNYALTRFKKKTSRRKELRKVVKLKSLNSN